ncbi:MAG: hypothetical protein WBN75_04320 [Verrucomicrobiia bacterium]
MNLLIAGGAGSNGSTVIQSAIDASKIHGGRPLKSVLANFWLKPNN